MIDRITATTQTTQQSTQTPQDLEENRKIPTQISDRPDMTSADSNPIGALLELVRSAKLDFEDICVSQCADRDEQSLWHYTLSLLIDGCEYSHHGIAPSKQVAKSVAYARVYAMVKPMLSLLRDQVRSSLSFTDSNKVALDLAFQMIREHLAIALKISEKLVKPVCVHILDVISAPYKTITIDDRVYSYQLIDNEVYVLSATSQHFTGKKAMCISDLYFMQPRTSRSADGLKILVYYDTVANMMSNQPETPIEPVAQVGVQDNPGTMTIPHLPNPQPTAVTPAMAVQDPSLVSALEPLLPRDFLNPIGQIGRAHV